MDSREASKYVKVFKCILYKFLKRIYTDRVSKLCFKDPFHVATGW